MENQSSTISPLAAVLAVVITFILSMFAGVALLFVFGYEVALVFGNLLLIIVPLGYMLYKKVNIARYIGFELKPKTVLLGIGLGALLFLFDVFVSTALTALLGTSEAIEESNRVVSDLSTSTSGVFLVMISLSLAGICEEFTFRGFLQNAIGSRYSSKVAILVSSLTFGIFHLDLQGIYIIAGFLLGLVLGYIYHRWHLYVASAVAHATLNLIVLAILILAR